MRDPCEKSQENLWSNPGNNYGDLRIMEYQKKKPPPEMTSVANPVGNLERRPGRNREHLKNIPGDFLEQTPKENS